MQYRVGKNVDGRFQPGRPLFFLVFFLSMSFSFPSRRSKNPPANFAFLPRRRCGPGGDVAAAGRGMSARQAIHFAEIIETF